MKIAVLTGGGDCPGLNAAIRAVVRRANNLGHRVFGVQEGWKGLLKGRVVPLSIEHVSGILPQGGTLIGTSRVNPLRMSNGLKKCRRFFLRQRFDALISIGGEGTLRIATSFWEIGVPVVCVPKTIDNDTWGTDYTIGFDTAVQVATEAIDRLHSTAESHHRVMIVEVMGRHAGWIAAYAGIAGGADAVLIPEEEFDIRELCRIVRRRARRQRYFSLFVVAEDARVRLESGKILRTPLDHDEYGDVKLGGIGELLARALRLRISSEVRVTVLGHIQRGGTPTAFDRILATRLGVFAVDCVHAKKFGVMAALRGGEIRTVPLKAVAGRLKTVDPRSLEIARVFQ